MLYRGRGSKKVTVKRQNTVLPPCFTICYLMIVLSHNWRKTINLFFKRRLGKCPFFESFSSNQRNKRNSKGVWRLWWRCNHPLRWRNRTSAGEAMWAIQLVSHCIALFEAVLTYYCTFVPNNHEEKTKFYISYIFILLNFLWVTAE